MKTLADKIILVTKAKNEAEKSLYLLEQQGAEIIYFSTIKIIPMLESNEINKAVRDFNLYDYIVLTSVNAVDIFTEIAKANGLSLSGKKVAVTGKVTAEKCLEYNLIADIIPDEFSAKGLINKFAQKNIVGKSILIPGSSLSGNELTNGLEQLGASVNFVPIYNVIQNDKDSLAQELDRINLHKPDVFIFTSPSSFENFCEIISATVPQDYFCGSTVCAIGSTTEKAVRGKNVVVNIVPETYSLMGVAEAIIKYFQVTATIA